MGEAALLPPETAPPPDDAAKFYEVVNGRVVEKPSMGMYESMIAKILSDLLSPYVRAQQLGRVFIETLFRIDPAADLQRRPDLAFVSYERWPRERPLQRKDPGDVVPDLAVEIVSKSNGAADVIAKMKDYFKAGVRQVWIVYPVQETVHVYDSPGSIRVVQRGGEIDGGAVLPGFRLALETWLDEEPRPEE